MVHRSVHVKTLALAMVLLTIISTVPFVPAETIAAAPLGPITSNGSVSVGNAVAPTGTTVFAGDRISSVNPALLKLETGGRIEMTKAAAVLSRQGKTTVVTADKGLLRFNFKKGENVQINADKFQFVGGNDSARIGELGLDGKGQVVMTLAEGRFDALNTETGARVEVSPSKSLSVTTQGSAATTGAGATTGSSVTLAVIVAGVAAGTMIGVGISEAAGDQSPSTR
jgi:hypothetical protein